MSPQERDYFQERIDRVLLSNLPIKYKKILGYFHSTHIKKIGPKTSNILEELKELAGNFDTITIIDAFINDDGVVEIFESKGKNEYKLYCTLEPK